MRSLIIGGSGQDGVLISAQLLSLGHEVITVSRTASPLADVDQRSLDATDSAAIDALVAEVIPDQVFYLAAYNRSSEAVNPPLDADISKNLQVNAVAFASLLESLTRHASSARTLYASSCRVFGEGDGSLLNETAVKEPICPYGISKLAGMQIADVFRRDKGLFVSSAVLFNHESELRPATFLSKKLASTALEARENSSVKVEVGCLDDMADWGAARDYATAMRSILEAQRPEQFIVATGELRSVREFADACFRTVGLDWQNHVVAGRSNINRRWRLRGDAARLTAATGWRPQWTFDEMVKDILNRTEKYGRQRPTSFHTYL